MPPDMQPYTPTDPRYALPEDVAGEPPKPAAPQPKEDLTREQSVAPSPPAPEDERTQEAPEEEPQQANTNFTIFGAFEGGIECMLHPSKNTKRAFGQTDAIIHYYKAAVIPAFVLFVIGIFLLTSPTYALGVNTAIIVSSGTTGPIGIFLIIIVSLLLLNPIRIIVDSSIIHFFGRNVLRDFKQDYSKTMSATLYGILPSTLLSWMPLAAVTAFYWLAIPGLLASGVYTLPASAKFTPLIFSAIFAVIYLWSMVVTTSALSNQQKVKRPIAFIIICTAGIISIAAIVIISYVIGAVSHYGPQQIASFMYQFL